MRYWWCVVALAAVSAAGLHLLRWARPDRAPERSRIVDRSTVPGTTSLQRSRAELGSLPEQRRDLPTREEPRRAGRAGPRTAASTLRRLLRSPGWVHFNRSYADLPRLRDAQAELKRLAAALAVAQDPVVRQNLIFLAVLTLPRDSAHPWLETIARSPDPFDREDALVALAFDGEPWARRAFLGLASAPSNATVHRLLDSIEEHDQLAGAGTSEVRETLRSYRAIEVLDRRPYFKVMGFYFGPWWLPHPDPGPELRLDLLPAWLRRYPGHPGSDDMALRVARVHGRKGEHMAAARWYSRAATLPDQDVRHGAIPGLIATCELLLSPEQLDRLAHDRGLDTPNRSLVQYIRLRRLAAERGFSEAVACAWGIARTDSESAIAHGWNNRFAGPASRGLASGLTPLPSDDPLLHRVAPRPPPTLPPRAPAPRRVGVYRWDWPQPPPDRRLEPWHETVGLDPQILARQFRAWETLAELETRTARAPRDRRADLLYKQAAVFFHDPYVLFPAYGMHSINFPALLDALDRGTQKKMREPLRAARLRFETDGYSLLRAIDLFQRIERDHRGYAAMDRVVFSQGMAWKRLLDYRPYRSWSAPPSWRGTAERRQSVVRKLVGAFERCRRLFPDSPLAGPAARAALYWRTTRSDAFTH